MKRILVAIALALTVPAIGQSVQATNPQADHSPCQPVKAQQEVKVSSEVTIESCRELKKHAAKKHRTAKTEAERLDAEVNGNGHQGHNH